MKEIRSRIGSYSMLIIAILFVAYHVVSVVSGASSFVKLIQTPDAAVAHVESAAPVNTEIPGQADAFSQIEYGYNASEEYWPTRVIIDSAKIDLDLEGSMENQGTWNISETGANFAINTALPNGISGNTVIFGHDRPHLFRNIHDLKTGDVIILHANDQRFTYEFTGSEVVKPEDITVMDQTENPTLTLITCDGWLSQDRYVVTAKLTSVQAMRTN